MRVGREGGRSLYAYTLCKHNDKPLAGTWVSRTGKFIFSFELWPHNLPRRLPVLKAQTRFIFCFGVFVCIGSLGKVQERPKIQPIRQRKREDLRVLPKRRLGYIIFFQFLETYKTRLTFTCFCTVPVPSEAPVGFESWRCKIRPAFGLLWLL